MTGIAPIPASDPEVARLARSIDHHSLTAAYTDQILEASRAASLGDTGQKLNQIVLAAQEFDLGQLDSPLARAPVIGAVYKKFAMTREKAMARFDSVKTQVDKLVNHVNSTADLLTHRNADYQAMYEGVVEEHKLLGAHVEAIGLRLGDMEREFKSLEAAGGELHSEEKRAMLEACRNALAKRADDLRMLQHSTLQMMPMVRIIQSNNLSLVDKFQTIRQLTLPAWKRSFMLALALDEQKSAVELADSIDNATNALMKRNAELLHQNSVATAKANQRLVIDVETLREVHGKILLTFKEVRDAHEKGAAERKGAIAELERLRTEMAEGMKAVGLGEAA
jgi:uncharacterized protein YaaN involved in tellurite resistance